MIAKPPRTLSFSLLFAIGSLAIVPLLFAQQDGQIRRGSWAKFAKKAEILSASDEVVRTAPEGEVVRVRIVRDGWAEIGSSIPDLPGGKTRIENLVPATEQENAAWVAAGLARAEEERLASLPFSPDPPPGKEPGFEEAEAKIDAGEATLIQAPPRLPLSALALKEPVLGWFHPAKNVELTGSASGYDGTLLITGNLRPPIVFPGARAWSGELPKEESAEASPLAFIARLVPDPKAASELVVFRNEELIGAKLPRFAPDGSIWIAARSAGESLVGKEGSKGQGLLLRFSPDLRNISRVLPLAINVQDFTLDNRGRPVCLAGVTRRHGGGFLTRYFSEAPYERMWPDAPDGASRRLKLDFSSPALAEGPFAIWAKKSEIYPDFPTPLADWGAEPNAGQQIIWTNVPSGQNPIRDADLKPEALATDLTGSILVSGTIPFYMGYPDFDPFLIRLSPTGKLLWTNCFLNGLLSEPDQKTLALTIDPSNGDILVSYWQHGNNRRTLLLDPNGWLTKFTGTKGNIKITWIGRVEAESGKLKHSTYIYSRVPNPPNPGWPDLNSATANDLQVDRNGRVYVAGATTINFPTTANAFMPFVVEFGAHPMLVVLRPDLSAPHYSTYLSAGKGDVKQVAITPSGAAFCIGKHETGGVALPVSKTETFPFLSATPPEGVENGLFLALIPIPEEEATWSFDN